MAKLVKLIIVTFVIMQGLSAIISADQESELQNQLRLINKPSIKTFKTKYGEILDCIEIHKQLAFDHPLLRNHSIQMKPSRKISEKFPKFSLVLPTRQLLRQHKLATIVIEPKSSGVHGNINVWGQFVAPNQFTSGSVLVASHDESVQNYIAVGWHVNQPLYQDNLTRLYTFWTRDSSKTTGCFNLLCPGFVQVSQEMTPGMVSQPLSIYGGDQYEMQVYMKRDKSTGNWLVNIGGKNVGYFPRELFTTLACGTDGVGWGGEIASPGGQPLPPVGSGHFPEEGMQKACYITHLEFAEPNGNQAYLSDTNADIKKVETKSQCYRAKCGGDGGATTGNYMFFGGPPDCQV